MNDLIISVGNIAMGGTGKTPFTIYLAKHFAEKGCKVAILSLGYKGKLGYDTAVISSGVEIFHKPPYAADEPYMMAKELLKYGVVVITGKNRNDSYKVAKEKYNCDIILLDDGFQHKKMRRDVDIVLLDHKRPISTGLPFPFGYLREFPSGLSRADVIVFTRANTTEIPEKAKKYCEGKLVFFCEHTYSGFLVNGKLVKTDFIVGKKVWLMSGISNGGQFEDHIRNLGGSVLGHSKFKDHHNYTDKEIETVLKSAEGAELILTTEKDMVKMSDRYVDKFSCSVLSLNMLNDGLLEYLDQKIIN